MDNKLDSKNKILKITIIDIYPPINELSKPKEDFNIIFQGNDNFYDFKKHLISKIPIQLSFNKKSLIITLLKNNNIFAIGFFTIRQGEQTIVFNYENNKKNLSSKTVNINNLSECIKIKFFCEYENSSTISTANRSTINANYENINNKYVTKVNLMKPIRINNYKNKFGKKIYDKKKRILNGIHQTNNNSMKKNAVNDSQELGGGNYTAFLTEEMSNFKQNFNTNNNSEMKKYNKIISNTARKNESNNNIGINRITKAKSKNFLSTNKKQSKNYGNHIKMNNSSLNIINQSNKINSSDNYQNYENSSINNRNYNTNRNSLKSNTSYNKMTKRNSNNSNLNNKNIKTSLNNYVSGNIIEHVNGNEKINYISINKNIERNNNKDIKKIKKNNNNITMNSMSTTITKKNELEFSMNSFQDYEDKNISNSNMSNKNTLKSFTNRTNNEGMIQKLSGDKNIIFDNTNRNLRKHKFNKSLCQQSFTEKIFNENFNFGEKNENYYNLCRSANKLVVNYNDNDINNTDNKILINEDKNISTNNFNEEENDNDLLYSNYTKLKEDFNLLYNLEYINKINEDLLKLELELFIEKMSELFSAYHTQMDEKILEHEIINKEYKTHLGNYLLYNKLKDKLEFFKKKLNKEKDTKKRKQYNENVKTNINEIDIFKIIFPDLINKEDKNNKLKNILSIILKNKENQELIGEKYDKIKELL